MEQAGVAKSTIYRRYTDKADLLLAAVECTTDGEGASPDTGSLADDLFVIAQHLRRVLTTTDAGKTLPATIAAMARYPALAQAHQAFLSRRRQAALTAVERGIARGHGRAHTPICSSTWWRGRSSIGPSFAAPGSTTAPSEHSWMQRWRPIASLQGCSAAGATASWSSSRPSPRPASVSSPPSTRHRRGSGIRPTSLDAAHGRPTHDRRAGCRVTRSHARPRSSPSWDSASVPQIWSRSSPSRSSLLPRLVRRRARIEQYLAWALRSPPRRCPSSSRFADHSAAGLFRPPASVEALVMGGLMSPSTAPRPRAGEPHVSLVFRHDLVAIVLAALAALLVTTWLVHTPTRVPLTVVNNTDYELTIATSKPGRTAGYQCWSSTPARSERSRARSTPAPSGSSGSWVRAGTGVRSP